MSMLYGSDDWDALLEEAYVRGVLEGRISFPKPQPKMTLEDYGRSITFSADELGLNGLKHVEHSGGR